MLKNISAALLCATAPGALFAEQVELRSTDGFISVDGEIVGYNGRMVSVETSVGRVSVPATEVICYGTGCLDVIENNDFGLTIAAFQDVVAQEQAAEVASGGADEFTVSFAAPVFDTIYRSVVGAYAMTGQTTAAIDVSAAGDITLDDSAAAEVATLKIGAADTPANATVGTVALKGTQPAVYAATDDWALASGLSDQLLGVRAFAVIIAPGIEINGISMQELAGIYAGEITNWSDLGGPDLAILPLQLPVNSTLRAELIKVVMDPAGKTIAGNVLTMADGISIASSVNQFAGSISIVGVEDAGNSITLPVSGSCDAPVALTTFNVISGDYPLIRPVMISFADMPSTSLTSDVFDFAASATAQRLISAEGFEDFSAQVQDEVEKNRRLNRLLGGSFDEAERLAAAQMFQRLFEAERLSPTMLGGTTSGIEGGWNRAMFETLARALADSDMNGREVMFVGFGSNANGSEQALAMSAQAAQDMEAAFARFAPSVIASNALTLSSQGFGNISPATCYESQAENANPTRVEVWLK